MTVPARDPKRWQEISAALDELLDLDPEPRRARLEELRTQDALLADELDRLLAQEDTTDSLLDTPLVTAPPGPREGERVGPYRLLTLLGEGGMGQVWKAERADGLYERQVALKLLRPGLADPNLRLRFSRERQILARLAHPHIARLLDAGISESGQPYLALEHIEGEGILEYCRKRALSLRARLQLFRQVCEAVTHAHGNLVVHRDLKPSNILVTPEGQVQLLDFGIAKLLDGEANEVPDHTRTGLRSFTLHYAAPEQIRGEPVTTQTDVYSLGVVLYELLTGQKPYRLKRESSAQWEDAILASEPERASVAAVRADEHGVPAGERKRWSKALVGDLDNIVAKALSKRPAHRYASAEALSLDVERFLGGLPVLARPQAWGYRVHKFIARHWWPILLTVGIVALLLALLGVAQWQRQQAVREAARAQALQAFVVDLFEGAGVAQPGKPMEVETLIAEGEARGERELALQPRAHAELLGVMARLRIALGQYAQADRLLQKQRGIIATLGNAPPSLILDATTQRGRVQRLQGEARACIATLKPMEANARLAERASPALSAEFYSQLARCQRSTGERDSARRLFEQSLALRRSTLGDDIGVVENLTDIAALSVDGGDHPQALRGFEGALAQLRRIAGVNHPLNIDILRSIGTTRQVMAQYGPAADAYAEALRLSDGLQGTSHPVTLELRRALAQMYVEQGRYRDAERELKANHPLLLQRYGARNLEVANSWELQGQVAAQLGNATLARRAWLAAAEIQRTLKQDVAYADTQQRLAMLALDENDVEQARQAMAAAMRARGQANAEDWLMRARIAQREGNEEEFSNALTQAAQLQPGAAGIALLRGRIAIDRADHANAESRVEDEANAARAMAAVRTLADAPVTDLRRMPDSVRAQAMLAEWQCHNARDDALLRFDGLLAMLKATRPDGGRVVREVERLRETCAARVKPMEGAAAPARSRLRRASPS